jgi:hypothetical protein
MTDVVHGQPPHDGDDDSYESHWYRVMRSIAHHDTDAEGAAAQEADAARQNRRQEEDGPEVFVTVAEDPSEAEAQR